MRVQRQCVVDADRDTVWKVVSSPECYPEFMASLERWEMEEDGPASLGARYTVHWKVGSVPIGGVIEVVEFDPSRELSWVGLTGVSQRGRFRLRSTEDGRTKVTFRLSYESAGNRARPASPTAWPPVRSGGTWARRWRTCAEWWRANRAAAERSRRRGHPGSGPPVSG